MSATPPHSPTGPIRPVRAPQACRRCRQKKLKCTGGQPCRKCQRAATTCDFEVRSGVLGNERGAARSITAAPLQAVSNDAAIRIAQLEKTLSDLISGLHTPAPTFGAVGPAQPSTSMNTVPNAGSSTGAGAHMDLIPMQQQMGEMPPPMSTSMSMNDTSQWVNTNTYPNPGPPSNSSLPPVNIFGLSPASQDAYVARQQRAALLEGVSPSSSTKRKANPEDPEARLETASTSYAPFQSLTYHPSNWDNREISRPSSPRPEESVPAFEARAGRDDDPVSLGWITEETGNTLVTL